mmetsp:Transcript_14176/g.16440  ORF Transcript_14176/g.16440 Transcript_14176/m.16440 type:complete len:86 (-) Transcript_14176:333-590(-)
MKVLQMDPCDSDLAIPAFETDYFVLVTEAFVFERDHYDSVLAASVFEMDCFSPAIKIFEKDHFFQMYSTGPKGLEEMNPVLFLSL